MCALDQIRGLHCHDAADFIQESLRAWYECCVGRLRHLTRHQILRCVECCPVVVGQPQRHLDVEDIQQLDEMVRPARRNRARTHGIFKRQIPTDDPSKELPERRVRIGVRAARKRDHRREFRITKCRERTTQAGKAPAYASGYVRPPLSPRRAACSAASSRTRGCPCNSSFRNSFPVSLISGQIREAIELRSNLSRPSRDSEPLQLNLYDLPSAVA